MTRAADLLLSFFDRIYIINLVHRGDRRREMQAELARLGLGLDHAAVTLFPASAPPDQGNFVSRGARGCFESHLAVHKDIVSRGLSHALVLEDDADFVPNFERALVAPTSRLKEDDWDMFYSVQPVEAQAGDEELGNGLISLGPEHTFRTTHFLGFSARFSRRAVDYLQTLHDRERGDPRGGPMHVDGAYGWMRKACPDLRVLATKRPLSTQRASRSDIADLRVWDRLPVVRGLTGALRRSAIVRAVRRPFQNRSKG